MDVRIVEDFAPIGLVNAARATWPDERWPYWHRYSGTMGEKFATKDPSRLTLPCQQIIGQMSGVVVPDPECFPDLELHGAGMHWIREGGCLPCHRDAVAHPLTGWTRRYNAILYLDTCSGGDLVFSDDNNAETSRVAPVKNRLVIFPVSSRHEVEPVISGERRSLSLFWWDNTGSASGPTSARWGN